MDENNLMISWDDFQIHAPNTFKQLWNNQDFTDVSLVTVDYQQIRAHKVILSAASDFFQKVLLINPNANPLLYLKDIRHKELENIIKFIYLGHCYIDHDDLETFLAAGHALCVKGLTKTIKAEDIITEEIQKSTDPHNVVLDSSVVNLENMLAVEKIKQTKKIDGKYECKCGVKYAEKFKLKLHISSKHGGERYSCDQCDHKAIQRSHLKAHKLSIHAGVKYSCDNCDHIATTKSSLNAHVQVQHDGVRYQCDQCDYVSKTNAYLSLHKQSIHNGVLFKCEHCDQKFKWERDSAKHARNKHADLEKFQL